MTLSSPMLMLASGLWLLLLAGCVVFALFANKQKERAEQAEAALREHQGMQAQAMSETEDAQAEGTTDASAPADVNLASENAMYLDQLERLRDMLRASEEQADGLREELERSETTAASRQGVIDSLEAERDILQRQVQNLSAGIEAGGKDTMREMIVNFTEESRELLEAIEQAGREKAELQQMVKDMQADGKGTSGTVIGLQRKLSQAEAQIAQLQQGQR
ncbi:MAG: hypothetical protein HKO60_03050 [Pseudomonadales bacterium]|nr:hypothetical protein [Pseudomonadales bacterium]